MAVLFGIWKTCRKGLLLILVGLSVLFAQSDIPYGKVVKDSLEWPCCYSKGVSYFVLDDVNPWEFVDYNPESWACCFIDPALRKYEILQIQKRIRNDSLERIAKARMDSVDAVFFNSFPAVGPSRIDSASKQGLYRCYKLGDGSEMCSHVGY